MEYNWQHPDWPKFKYNSKALETKLYEFAKLAGKTFGAIRSRDADFGQPEILDVLINEALTTSKIESVDFHPEDLRASMLKLIDVAALGNHQHTPLKTDGLAKLMLDVYRNFKENLYLSDLFRWHKFLFEGRKIETFVVGEFRKSLDPMQIVSGPIGKEKVFFEAPPSDAVEKEMNSFLVWFNSLDSKNLPGPIRAAIAHLYFESIHPFEDGNGRIGRAIAFKALSQDIGYPCVFSLSSEIWTTKKEYYVQLHRASSFTLNIDSWLEYFLDLVLVAQTKAQANIEFLICKAQFWKKFQDKLNIRQEKLLKKLFEIGVGNFKGQINTRKYVSLTGCSKATATRDLTHLFELGVLKKANGSGRSTGYFLEDFNYPNERKAPSL